MSHCLDVRWHASPPGPVEVRLKIDGTHRRPAQRTSGYTPGVDNPSGPIRRTFVMTLGGVLCLALPSVAAGQQDSTLKYGGETSQSKTVRIERARYGRVKSMSITWHARCGNDATFRGTSVYTFERGPASTTLGRRGPPQVESWATASLPASARRTTRQLSDVRRYLVGSLQDGSGRFRWPKARDALHDRPGQVVSTAGCRGRTSVRGELVISGDTLVPRRHSQLRSRTKKRLSRPFGLWLCLQRRTVRVGSPRGATRLSPSRHAAAPSRDATVGGLAITRLTKCSQGTFDVEQYELHGRLHDVVFALEYHCYNRLTRCS